MALKVQLWKKEIHGEIKFKFQNNSGATNPWMLRVFRQQNTWNPHEFCPWMLLLSPQWLSCSSNFSSFQIKYSHLHEAFFCFCSCKLHSILDEVTIQHPCWLLGDFGWQTQKRMYYHVIGIIILIITQLQWLLLLILVVVLDCCSISSTRSASNIVLGLHDIWKNTGNFTK